MKIGKLAQTGDPVGLPRDVLSFLPFDLLRGLGDEEADGVGGNLGAARVDGDLGVAAIVGPHLQREQQQLELDEAELRGLGEGHPGEGGGQRLRVHLAPRAWGRWSRYDQSVAQSR